MINSGALEEGGIDFADIEKKNRFRIRVHSGPQIFGPSDASEFIIWICLDFQEKEKSMCLRFCMFFSYLNLPQMCSEFFYNSKVKKG